MSLGARARLYGLLELQGLADAATRIDIENNGGPAGCRLPVEENAAAAVAAAAFSRRNHSRGNLERKRSINPVLSF